MNNTSLLIGKANNKNIRQEMNFNINNWNNDNLNISIQNAQGLSYGNGIFFSPCNTNTLDHVYSTDGITWKKANFPESVLLSDSCFGDYNGGRFVTISYGSNKAYYSDDGINWTATTLPSSDSWYSVCYGNGKFIIMDYNGNKICYSLKYEK